ncbi:bifunctional [glutamate--ammonia ligase]-adenylyl-L-tyrosine phosphorylase/[glutamate--ammonia-ligase] adenylyltransferase [Legionella sp. 27cVA30]|uniref:bifunctional [glutamate--ammonia ligase]-adenylyl-L-tyrosine phosphorylase/[glutamate--ammonia-ligase] adenylyltransferase n=1 Tax=Legionella TaxID=445 RepID=UPI000F8F2649|nr:MULTISPECIES: bifunctional [glutamate--ammonia ligase]-adenylyl-L-tyrosine phosphorylase/[glutamate--ammonia-ligase] adenylyltransferase [Legionella]MCP0913015.1 bifunctional [glutamate--ammonia ligase]-adenylyl-L-tyrosine phosphorylase/[glutamate--ammonia-ligase] adenylyltransferase [Legionella sp. 27cVA30]RUR15347.1 bifunctional [glutamate--ammonia ligase]-adenylyl-L-tyrosine phosphorylase/[glutamate--ammonia-ligase] adenylyltransferase [Legionella septentrionalis]
MTIYKSANFFAVKDNLFYKYFADLLHPLLPVAKHLLYVSNYACRQVANLQALLQEDDCSMAFAKKDYEKLLTVVSLDLPHHAFASQIRQFRHRQLLRLFLRELANLATTQQTMAAWSDCADTLILYTLTYCKQQLSHKYGTPRHENGDEAELYILAMGKLGGRELNFSSDVDLIFAFSAAGCTDGAERISNQQYYTKVAQLFTQLMQTMTADGFVFRIDLRLRPNGDSGPLVQSLEALETYYQEQGRDWERYAMVKARLIGQQKVWFTRLIKPFVYRRYVDFSVIESLRSMKAMIEREVQLNSMLDDIKRGRGGIREIEFIIQCFQLIRGGRLPQIQKENALEALQALKQERLLAHTDVLQQAYLFLRQLENTLQIHGDQQTHSLPQDELVRMQIAMAMSYERWEDLLEKLQQYRRIVSHAFHGVLGKADVYENEKRLLFNQLTSLWQGHVEPGMAVNLLASLGFKEAERCYQIIYAFRHAPRCRRLSQASRLRLDRFMVLLLSELAKLQNTDAVLLQVIRLLESIVSRSAYLALLAEKPNVLQELLHWFATSPFITSLLVEQPFLLEVLVDQDDSWQPANKEELRKSLQARLTHCVGREEYNEILRQFKLMCWLLAARSELSGHCDSVRIGRFLADVAEVIINEVLANACTALAERYPEIEKIKSNFAIIAYGKLGSQEMNYDSDVDLVFLHAAERAEESLVTRLTQKILHMLTMRAQAGVLYAVDTRLRPSGASGLLVSHIDAFIQYQYHSAWTWEHQALLRARILYGNTQLHTAFNQLKKDVLFLPRDRAILAKDIKEMRLKISKNNEDKVKPAAGELIDLEFLIQFLMLAYPAEEFVFCTHNLEQLTKLYRQKILSKLQFTQLAKAYNDCHQILHFYLLQPNFLSVAKFPKQIKEISEEFLLNK